MYINIYMTRFESPPLLEQIFGESSLARVLVKILILTGAPEFFFASIPDVSGKSAVGAQGASFSPLAPKLWAITIFRYPWKFP